METKIITVDNDVDSTESYQQAVDMLESGEVVAFPTETVYGLGANAKDEAAVAKIYEAKGRPSDNPLIIHIGRKEEVADYALDVSQDAEKLMDAFWPGPLTLVFKQVPGQIAANAIPGMTSVGLRMPDHPVALRLLQQARLPVAAPSANRSGKPSPTEAMHVYNDLTGRIPLIVDGGQTGVGLESTVLDMTTTPPTILRPGGVTKEMIERVIGAVHTTTSVEAEETPRAPGMKYAHYAPEAPLYTIEANLETIEAAIAQLHKEQLTVAVVGPTQFQTEQADWYFSIGSADQLDELAMNLYKALRLCDTTEADIILATETTIDGVGEAFMNRLWKAADGKRFVVDK